MTFDGILGRLIEPDQYDLSILPEEEVKGKKKIKTHTVTAQIKAVSGLEIKEGDFEFSWQDMTDNFKEVSTSETLTEGLDGHTYLLLATHRENKAARFSIVKSFTNPIYVCNTAKRRYLLIKRIASISNISDSSQAALVI